MANENVSPAVMQRLLKEVAQYVKSPVEGMQLQVNEENVTDIVVDFEGPGMNVHQPLSTLLTSVRWDSL